MPEELNLKEEAFCRFYPIYNNGAIAAKKAGYSAKYASHQAWVLMQKPKIKVAIEKYRDKAIEDMDMTAREAIQIIQSIARKTGKYGRATEKDCLNAARDIAKIHGVRGLTDKVIVREIPFHGWTEEEIRELARTGKVPEGKILPDLASLGEVIS